MALISSQCSEMCNRLMFEAIEENSISKLQSVLDTYNHNELLNSLIQCNEKGETPLVVAMKGRNDSVIAKLVILLQECANSSIKKNQLMCFIALDQLSQQIFIMELFDHLINSLWNEDWLEFIGQAFMKFTSFTRQDNIIALELIGASLVMTYFRGGNYEGVKLVSKHYIMCGLKCWRKAMNLRYFPDSVGEPLLPKTPAMHVPSVASSVVFGFAVEVTSMEELDELQQRFERANDFTFLRIQALLVVRRICIQANHGHPYWFYLQSLKQLAIDSENVDNDIAYAVNTYLLIMEQLTGFDPQMISKKTFMVFIYTLFMLLENCEFNQYRNSGELGEQAGEVLSHSASLIATVQFINTIVKYFPKPEMFSDLTSRSDSPFKLESHLQFVDVISGLLFIMESTQMDSEKEQLEKDFSNYIRNYFPERTTTPLHVAAQVSILYCYSKNNEIQQKPQKTIKRILNLGGDPNAIDENGETPLHRLATNQAECAEYEPDALPTFLATFQSLVDAGGHLDMASDNGDTVISILKKNFMECKRSGLSVDPYFHSIMNTVFPLSCYAARVIRRHGIRFDEDRLPTHLQKFVSSHSAKDFTE